MPSPFVLPAGRHESLWLATTPTTAYEPLAGNCHVDTAVIGGGIAGITTAAKLREAGQSVALFERDRILRAVTGHSTAKLTALHGLPYRRLRRHFGERGASLYAQANQAAIDDVAGTVDQEAIDCDFTRRSVYTYTRETGRREELQEEVDAARAAGLDVALVTETELPFQVDAAVELPNQAAFHPRAYLLELARQIPGDGSYLFEETTVRDVDTGSPCEVVTDRGSITADAVAVTTHFPIVDKALYFARLRPKRSYVLAARVAESAPEGMYYGDEKPYFSLRPVTVDDDKLVLFGGQEHRTGEGPTSVRYRALERQVRNRFDIESIEYYWSTQDYVSVDYVPFIGALAPQTTNLYVATGFGGWGMTGGTVAGIVLRDLILDRDNEWAEVYDPTRLQPGAGAREFLSHNVDAGERMTTSKLSRNPRLDRSLAPGEAGVFEVGDETMAVYRDPDGELHAVSAICTHMGCQVSWNDAEESWDCGCHGSRFDLDGSVLDTPANRDLQSFDLSIPPATGEPRRQPEEGPVDGERPE